MALYLWDHYWWKRRNLANWTDLWKSNSIVYEWGFDIFITLARILFSFFIFLEDSTFSFNLKNNFFIWPRKTVSFVSKYFFFIAVRHFYLYSRSIEFPPKKKQNRKKSQRVSKIFFWLTRRIHWRQFEKWKEFFSRTQKRKFSFLGPVQSNNSKRWKNNSFLKFERFKKKK